MKHRFVYPIVEHDAYDGDTVRVMIDRGFEDYKRLSVRIKGVDTPEIRTKDKLEKEAGLAARDFVNHWLACLAWCGESPGVLMFDSIERDKFSGRGVGDLFPAGSPDVTLSDVLLSSHIARPYDGGKKEPWTRQELFAILNNPTIQSLRHE